MGTAFETIETRAMMYIKNDITLDQDLTTRLPLFYNRMKSYLLAGKSYFNKPPRMTRLLGKYTAPLFEELFYVPAEEARAPITITTELTGYDIHAVGIIENDKYGVPQYVQIESTYNAETGEVVINQDIAQGTNVVIDLYKSGEFEADFTDEQIEILAYCVYVAWENRFINNVLERTAKIRDSGFSPISEASHMAANTERIKLANDTLQDMLRHYEQNEKYIEVVGIQ